MSFNEKKNLILVKNKNSSTFKDVTNKIESIKNSGGFVSITFENSPQYTYSSTNVLILKDPISIPLESKTYQSDGIIISGILEILRFKNYYKVFFGKGRSSLYLSLEPLDNLDKKDVFGYFRDLVEQSALASDDNSVEAILKKSYDKLTEIMPKSVMSQFLKKESFTITNPPTNLFFPFPFNLSQKKAVINALQHSVSIVQGPPGTGKTQMILNLIANLVKSNKTILIVSNNNEAIKNIEEKLKQEDLGEISALLGRKDNKIDFFEKIRNELSEKESFKPFSVNSDYQKLIEETDKNYELENKKASIIEELDAIKLEYKHFENRFPFLSNDSYAKSLNNNLSSQAYLLLKQNLIKKLKLGFFSKLFLFVNYGFVKKYKHENLDDYFTYLEHRYYQKLIVEKELLIKQFNKELLNSDFETIKEQIIHESRKEFINIIQTKLDKHKSNEFTELNFIYKFKDFVDRYPVILSTSFSVLNSLPSDTMIDYLIIDEASQSDLLSNVLPMMKAKNVVIVGDEQQLPAIPNPSIVQTSIFLANKYGIEEPYHYHSSNLLKAFNYTFRNAPKVILREHYRCHSEIIGFSNRNYYHNELIINSKIGYDQPLTVLKTVEGLHARKYPKKSGMYNLREIDEILKILEEHKDFGSIGVITPFRIQAEELRKRINFDTIEIDTVHRFQGREKDLIIISTVVNGINEEKANALDDFINDYRLLNVALTRAKKKLILITSDGVFQTKKTELAKLIGYIKYHLPEQRISEGSTRSIFDELYKKETKIILGKNEFLSEKLTANILEKLLVEFPEYAFAMHVRLSKIAKINGFLDNEMKYLNHPWTHVDFLIYSRLTYEPVLVIEVDGVKYHEKKFKQLQRDSLKDLVLEKSNVKILRLKTNESGEVSRIRSMLT
jgi:superfamily I DNA and/or RNA helicase